MRSVLVHYPIYKNAGTSVGHVLSHSFGGRHLSFDGPFPFFTIDQEQLDRIITRKADAVAFSSHQIQLPAPVSPAYRVLAAVFLRHPVLRIASIWRFKRAQDDGTTTSAAARALGFAPWLVHCLSDPSEIVHVSNAQTRLLGAAFRARAVSRRGTAGMEYDLSRAEANLAGADLVGRADHFAEDVARFLPVLDAAGLPLSLPPDLHLNATAGDGGAGAPRARADALLRGLPPDLAGRLIAANAQDLALYAQAEARIAALAEAA